MIIFRIFVFVLCFSIFLNADFKKIETDFMRKDFKITLDWLKTKPKSPSRDFFIIQYLKQNKDLSVEKAQEVYDMRYGKNNSLDNLFNKRYKKVIPPEDLECYRASVEYLKNSEERCMSLGLSLKLISKLSKDDLNFFISKTTQYPTLKNDLLLFLDDDYFNSFMKAGPKKFLQLFFALDQSFVIKNLNRNIPYDFLLELKKEKDFHKFLRYAIFNDAYKNIQKSLLNLYNVDSLANDMYFILGVNAVNNNNLEIAETFFLDSFSKTQFRDVKDKSLFWLYLVTKDDYYLEELAKSWDNNSLYVLYAKELLDVKLENIFFTIDIKNKTSKYDIYNVFDWIDVVNDIKTNFDESKLEKYSEIFTDERTIPHMAFLLERYSKSKNQYFLTPYKKTVEKYDIFKQIMLYSLAKQESKFIPSAISVSSAIGVMQIMPFLSSDISEKIDDEYNIYDQFIPGKNIEYASFHLDNLIKRFDGNPLFIAYAYNGGEGYTNRQLRKGLFKEKNQFEPFLSMELISYKETREYGKKVLANYYIYNNYLNSEHKITLSSIFESLKSPY